MNNKRLGKQSVSFDIAPRILSSGTVVGDVEGQGPIGKHFDLILEDDMWGGRRKAFEKSECKMYERAVRIASQKANIDPADLDCFIRGRFAKPDYYRKLCCASARLAVFRLIWRLFYDG